MVLFPINFRYIYIKSKRLIFPPTRPGFSLSRKNFYFLSLNFFLFFFSIFHFFFPFLLDFYSFFTKRIYGCVTHSKQWLMPTQRKKKNSWRSRWSQIRRLYCVLCFETFNCITTSRKKIMAVHRLLNFKHLYFFFFFTISFLFFFWKKKTL